MTDLVWSRWAAAAVRHRTIARTGTGASLCETALHTAAPGYFAAVLKRTPLTYGPTDRFASAAVWVSFPFSRRLSIVTP